MGKGVLEADGGVGCTGGGKVEAVKAAARPPHFYERAVPCQGDGFLRTMRLHFYSCSRHKRLIPFFRHPISKSSSKDSVRPRVDGSSLSHRRKNSLIKTDALRPQSPDRSQYF